MHRKFRPGVLFSGTLVLLAATLTASCQAANPDGDQPASTASKLPTCAAVADAIKTSYGAVSSYKDETSMEKKMGESPYPLARFCRVYVAGSRLPLNIIFNSISAKKIDALEHGMEESGRVKKVDSAGWNHPVYLTSLSGRSASTLVSIDGQTAMHVSTHASPEDAMKITQAILKLI